MTTQNIPTPPARALRTARVLEAGHGSPVLLSVACWHTPSLNYYKALRAIGVNVHAAEEGAPAYRAVDFPGPHHLFVQGHGLIPAAALHEVPVTTQGYAAQAAFDPASSAALAVLQNNVQALMQAWPQLSGDERTQMLCLAVTLGADTCAHFCVERVAINQADAAPAHNTPLHYAAMSDQTAMSLLLLEHGANPSAKNIVHTQPAHDAARSGAAGTVEALFARGVDLTVTNAYGDTVLHRLAEHVTLPKQDAFVQVLQFCMRDVAARRGSAAVQDYINQPNHRGFTALDMATARDQQGAELAAALCDRGALHSHVWHALSSDKRTRDELGHFSEWLAIRARMNATTTVL